MTLRLSRICSPFGVAVAGSHLLTAPYGSVRCKCLCRFGLTDSRGSPHWVASPHLQDYYNTNKLICQVFFLIFFDTEREPLVCRSVGSLFPISFSIYISQEVLQIALKKSFPGHLTFRFLEGSCTHVLLTYI